MSINVPTYTRRAKLQGLPGVRQSGQDAVGQALEGVGQGIARAGQGLGDAARAHEQVASREKAKFDNARVQQAFTQLMQAKQSLLEDPENGFANAKGERAIRERDSVLSFYAARAEKIRGGLSDPDQAAAFDSIWGEEQTAFASVVDRHTAREAEAFKKQAHESALALAVGNARGSALRGDFAESNRTVMSGLGAIDATAEAERWDKATAEQARRQFETQARVGVVEAMLENGTTKEAREYLDVWRGYLDEAMLDKSRAVEKVQAAGKRDEAQSLAAEAWDASRIGKSGKPGDPDAYRALEWLRAKGVKDPAVLKDAMDNVRQHSAEDLQAKRQADTERLARLEQQLATRHNFSDNDPDLLELYPEGRAEALKKRDSARKVSKDSSAADQREIREKDRYLLALYDGLDLVGENGEDQVSVDVDKLGATGSPTLREQLRKRQKSRNAKIAKDNGASALDFVRLRDAAIQRAGVPDHKVDTARNFLNRLHSLYEDPKGHGAGPPKPELEEALAKWLAYDDGGYFGKQWWAFERADPAAGVWPRAEESPQPPPEPVPQAERESIIEAYRKKHSTAPSEAQILDYYRKHRKRTKQEPPQDWSGVEDAVTFEVDTKQRPQQDPQ